MASRSSSPPSPGLLPLVPAAEWFTGHSSGYRYGNQLMHPPNTQSCAFYGPPPWTLHNSMLPIAPSPPADRYVHHPPPRPQSPGVIRSEITISHSTTSPIATSPKHADNARATQTPTHVAVRCHICSICRRPRSSKYHRQHPLVPGQQIIPEPCRKCRTATSSSSSEDDRKVIVNQPGKRAVKESERVRILPVKDKDPHKKKPHRHRSGSRTRIVIREHRSGSPAPLQGHDARGHHHEAPRLDETGDYRQRPHERPGSRLKLRTEDTGYEHEGPPRQGRMTGHPDDHVTIVRCMESLRALSISPDPAPDREQERPRMARYDHYHTQQSLKHKPSAHNSMSDAERRLLEHPRAFRHGIMAPASPKDTPCYPSSSRMHIEESSRRPALRPRDQESHNPPRPPCRERRSSVTYASHAPVTHCHDTGRRSILRSQSRPRAGNWPPPPNGDRHGEAVDGADMTNHAAHRVTFAPEHSYRRELPPDPRHDRGRGRAAARGPPRHRAHFDGPASSSESVDGPGPRRSSDHEQPSQPSSRSRLEDSNYGPRQQAPKGRILRRVSFSSDDDGAPPTNTVRHVPPASHVTYYRSTSPHTRSSAPARTTYTDYAGTHSLPEPSDDDVSWSHRPMYDSSDASGSSYRLAGVREFERVRQLEQTHHPRRDGYHDRRRNA